MMEGLTGCNPPHCARWQRIASPPGTLHPTPSTCRSCCFFANHASVGRVTVLSFVGGQVVLGGAMGKLPDKIALREGDSGRMKDSGARGRGAPNNNSYVN